MRSPIARPTTSAITLPHSICVAEDMKGSGRSWLRLQIEPQAQAIGATSTAIAPTSDSAHLAAHVEPDHAGEADDQAEPFAAAGMVAAQRGEQARPQRHRRDADRDQAAGDGDFGQVDQRVRQHGHEDRQHRDAAATARASAPARRASAARRTSALPAMNMRTAVSRNGG